MVWKFESVETTTTTIQRQNERKKEVTHCAVSYVRSNTRMMRRDVRMRRNKENMKTAVMMCKRDVSANNNNNQIAVTHTHIHTHTARGHIVQVQGDCEDYKVR